MGIGRFGGRGVATAILFRLATCPDVSCSAMPHQMPTWLQRDDTPRTTRTRFARIWRGYVACNSPLVTRRRLDTDETYQNHSCGPLRRSRPDARNRRAAADPRP